MFTGVTAGVFAGIAAVGAMLYVRDLRTAAFVILAAAAAAYALSEVPQSEAREAADLFGAGLLLERLKKDERVSVSDQRIMEEALGATIDAYLRSLTPNSRRPASAHAADYDAHRTRTLHSAEPLPEYVGRACQTIFDRLDTVLVWKRLMHTRGASPFSKP
jgi:hypothetical protein